MKPSKKLSGRSSTRAWEAPSETCFPRCFLEGVLVCLPGGILDNQQALLNGRLQLRLHLQALLVSGTGVPHPLTSLCFQLEHGRVALLQLCLYHLHLAADICLEGLLEAVHLHDHFAHLELNL